MKTLILALCILIMAAAVVVWDFFANPHRLSSDLDEANGGIDDDDANYQREIKIAAMRKDFGP